MIIPVLGDFCVLLVGLCVPPRADENIGLSDSRILFKCWWINSKMHGSQRGKRGCFLSSWKAEARGSEALTAAVCYAHSNAHMLTRHKREGATCQFMTRKLPREAVHYAGVRARLSV